ncbi:Ig-like domain-containing protein [uncultured Methanobrevibacter sp.]|uniref:Ig-like domain-containing protein n=1 Tax=uncultured Methanobrevibacter sp. TaxID=253161 RepID=UPI0025DF8630|nr:Ig-like domain-containing protein [uncultured Methanobrevibacter sp.]
MDAGIYTLNVTTISDKNHNPVTKTANITVNKVDTKIGANDLELAFGDKTKLVYVLMPEYTEGNITFSSSNPGIANVSTIGEVTAVSVGTANITITFEGNKNYEKTNKTIKVKVNKVNSTQYWIMEIP